VNLDILPLEIGDITEILLWNDKTTPEFLLQWAGMGYTYPLTSEQISEKISGSWEETECRIFKVLLINGQERKMIGTVELNTVNMPKRCAMVCRFLMAPHFQGKGYGTIALMLLIRKAFAELGFKILRLRVFAFNEQALRCYEKAGFRITTSRQYPNGWQAYDMELRKKAWM
jgi:RimJ/RimL family protein N-acetyltransferase